MARKRRAKDYEDHQSIRPMPKKRTDRPRLTVAQAKEDIQQAGRQEGSPGMLVLAVLAVTLFIGFYYHILALQGMQQLTGGTPMLDHHVSGFTITDVEHLAERMDDDALGQYNWVHITAGRIFPVMLGLSVISVGLWTLRTKLAKWGAVAAAVIYAGLEIWASITREAVLQDITEANTSLASTLTVLQWLVFAFLIIWIVAMLVLKFIGRNNPGLATSMDPEREIP
ncbi:hypothetical protein [Yaniella halotolerans]|uniref:hypothetical protein n=1 Tax=Yaniella halotolerans TaxID=225453 RepID=UPI0012EBCA6B|nr:hypothetical protein [Yaniella halotolerans]